MEQLERVDKALLRKLLCVSSKSVVCGMFLELGLWPIKVVLIGKRVMFLHYILSRPETDLVYRVFQAQDKHPVKNDWAIQVRKDLEDLGMSDLSHEEIKLKSKEAFKKLVKEKCTDFAFSQLMKEAESKSKMKHLKYNKLEMQNYLKSNRLNTMQKKLLFKIRIRAVDTPDSYGRDEQCRICNVERDQLSHVTECVVLKLLWPDMTQNEANTSDAYDDDVEKQRSLAIKFQRMWRIRKRILTNT